MKQFEANWSDKANVNFELLKALFYLILSLLKPTAKQQLVEMFSKPKDIYFSLSKMARINLECPVSLLATIQTNDFIWKVVLLSSLT